MTTPFHGDSDHTAYHVLQQLQQRSRANIAGMMSQRAPTTFNLQPEPPSTEAHQMIDVCVYPQNPFVGEPEVRQMPAADIQRGLINSRIRIVDDRPIAQPDENGNYLYWPGSPEFDQINALYYSTFALRMYERYAHRAIPWAFPSTRLMIHPAIGDNANAFYHEQERIVGFQTYRTRDGNIISTARSADIVAHEIAHAILDGLRDLWNESFGLGPRGFHESFGDITAMLVALHDDALLHRLLKWTKGDLRMSNFVSEVAEHLAQQQQDDSESQEFTRQHTIYLRNAFNKLEAISFDQLSYLPDDPQTELSRQEHNYSRLFTGAIYDILVGIYEHLQDQHDIPQLLALHQARDVIGHLITLSIEVAPVGEFNFADMARAVITAENIRYDGDYYRIVQQVFAQRNILTADAADAHREALHTLPDISLPETMRSSLDAGKFLEQTILPALDITPVDELMPLSTYRNAEGIAFMTFFSARQHQLDGEQYGDYIGTRLDVFGGLSLAFNADNRLCSAVYRPITQTDMEQLGVILLELIEHSRIVDHLSPSHEILRPNPKGLYIGNGDARPPIPPSGRKLVKYPAVYDTIPEHINDFVSYLRQIKQNLS